MPLYEYRCNYCGNVMDEWRTVSDRHNTPECDNDDCRSGDVVLQLSKTSHRLKGAGWASDGYSTTQRSKK